MRSRYIYDTKGDVIFAQEGENVVLDNRQPEPKAGFYVVPDIQPYQSMIDGRMITSRAMHREHLRANNCVEIGNDSSLHRQPQPLKPPPGLKEEIIRVVNHFEEKRRRH
tara:strand:- start:651 stop:977 length:327 start_codon:yes stop_codon:yes gene_type:complete